MEIVDIQQTIEALFFISPKTVTIAEVLLLIENKYKTKFSKMDINVCIEKIKNKYSTDEFILELVEIDGGYKFLSKKKYHFVVEHIYGNRKNKKLSRSVMEVLSIVIYKSPVTKQEIEHIRGVNSDYSVEKLLEKGLIKIIGKSDIPGRPLIYGPGENFLDYTGLESLADLPKTKDMKFVEN